LRQQDWQSAEFVWMWWVVWGRGTQYSNDSSDNDDNSSDNSGNTRKFETYQAPAQIQVVPSGKSRAEQG
jgi:hypothetical protein